MFAQKGSQTWIGRIYVIPILKTFNNLIHFNGTHNSEHILKFKTFHKKKIIFIYHVSNGTVSYLSKFSSNWLYCRVRVLPIYINILETINQ